MAGEVPHVVLVDLVLPDGSGLELLREPAVQAGTDVVVVTGHASVDSAVEALREGAVDYLTKPLDRSRLRAVLSGVTRSRALRDEVSSLRGELRHLGRFGPMVGRSKPMQDVYDLISRVARTDASVLVTGESGTGKELVAETIHRLSARRNAPFIPVNCGAMAPTLIESELFGHEKGSFTGADRQRAGCFEQANGGTLFLDEIIEMPIELQVRLLRVLETEAVVRVGGNQPVPVDVRVVAASNQNPKLAVGAGRLREDLFFRLNVFPIALPPLRERGDDVALLAEHYLQELNQDRETRKRWTPAALARIAELPWTGNVRELRNAVQRAYILAGDTEIGPEVLPESEAPAPVRSSGVDGDGSLTVRVGETIAEAERRLILATLESLGGNKKEATRMLGISLKTLYNRLAVYRAREGSEV
jgi:DNA-binding NtrC family response regulator